MAGDNPDHYGDVDLLEQIKSAEHNSLCTLITK